jgi:hypothetical protein
LLERNVIDRLRLKELYLSVFICVIRVINIRNGTACWRGTLSEQERKGGHPDGRRGLGSKAGTPPAVGVTLNPRRTSPINQVNLSGYIPAARAQQPCSELRKIIGLTEGASGYTTNSSLAYFSYRKSCLFTFLIV